VACGSGDGVREIRALTEEAAEEASPFLSWK
jgi:hypothetical protein